MFLQQEKRTNGENRIHGGLVVGRTIESYRIAMEEEIHTWDGFARALRKDDREAFDELMGMCRSFAMASSNATNPIIFEPIIMSILLAQQVRIRTLEKKLNAIKSEANSSSAGNPEIKEENYQAKTIPQPGPFGGDQTWLSIHSGKAAKAEATHQ
jgi:hypothetical protein